MDYKKGVNLALEALAPEIQSIRSQLEGPKPLRAIAAIAGAAMTAVSVLGLLNPFVNPIDYAMKIYMALFGLAIIVIESKSVGDEASTLKKWIYRWAPFVSIVGGKGFTYIFFGTLGLSFGLQHILLFASGCGVGGIGVLYVLIHFFKFEELQAKYDQSQYYAASQYNHV